MLEGAGRYTPSRILHVERRHRKSVPVPKLGLQVATDRQSLECIHIIKRLLQIPETYISQCLEMKDSHPFCGFMLLVRGQTGGGGGT